MKWLSTETVDSADCIHIRLIDHTHMASLLQPSMYHHISSIVSVLVLLLGCLGGCRSRLRFHHHLF